MAESVSFFSKAAGLIRRVGDAVEMMGLYVRNPREAKFALFLSPEAIEINKARLEHLASVGLDLRGKTVLEVGAGIGLMTHFYEERECTILSTDARIENVREMSRRFPNRKSIMLDIDSNGDLASLGMFDIIFCYGLLYHLGRPDVALKSLSRVTREIIVLETCVGLEKDIQCGTETEDMDASNQSIHGIGSRPTRPWVMDKLREYYGYAYVTKTQPRHLDFDLDWSNPVPKKNHRAVFVGSRRPLNLPTLSEALLDFQMFQKD